jgi:hypothetical protein
MKHLLEYESYSPVNEFEVKGGVPVYNEPEFVKNPKMKPAMMIKTPEIISVVDDFIKKQENGDIESIAVVADIPTQGKRVPTYVADELAAERKRMAARKAAIYGSRIERADRPEDEDYTDEINIFVDSEFVVKGVINKLGKDYVIGIPASHKKKAEASKDAEEYYSTYIEPNQIFEIYFTPKNK